MAMESTIVIKVIYGETLRRFNARVSNEKLSLNMDGLRDKIIQLFNFALDTELTLTYIDEDGDVVTLVDDEDLQDAMRQYLNPLRISVKSNVAERSGRPSARSSGNSTPSITPLFQPPSPNFNAGSFDALRFIPEHLRQPVMNLYADLTFRASSSAPTLVELVDGITKMGLSHYLNQASGSQPTKETRSQCGTSDGNTMSADGAMSRSFPSVQSGEPSLKKNEPFPALNPDLSTLKATEPKLKTALMDASVKLMPKLQASEADLTKPLPQLSTQRPKLPTSLVDGEEDVYHLIGGAPQFSFSSASPITPEKAAIEQQTETQTGAKPVNMGVSADPSGSSIKMPCDGFRYPGLSPAPTPMTECPFTGLPIVNEPLSSKYTPFGRSFNHSNANGAIFHRAVRCDGCGVHPITGPRFISKVKVNYDLCSICFTEMGKDADYIRMDRPVTYPHPWSYKCLVDPHRRIRPPTVSQVSRGGGMKPGRPELDSRFMHDVNILDGTVMTPLTPFTKIWRMRNSGSILWPQGTQLVWIAGDRISDAFSVELQVTTAAWDVDQELDVAVDFTAPELPGTYVSYWRMATPSGQNFGQRVWVHIQVCASVNQQKKESVVHGAFQGLNLNLHPVSDLVSGPEIINVNPEPVVKNALPEPNKISKTRVQFAESVVHAKPNKEQESKLPINDSLFVNFGDKYNIYPCVPGSSVSHFSEEALAVTRAALPSDIEVQEPLKDELTHLEELVQQLGFKRVNLDEEISRLNKCDDSVSDSEESVDDDDLYGVHEWGCMIEELEEMGFCDKEMNMKLLKKNNGSIKRVVMDLIAGEE